MNGIWQTNFLQASGFAVLNSLWQMALLWIVYQCITGMYTKARPSAKNSLAFILLTAGFTWFVYTFFVIYSHAGNDALVSIGLFNLPGNEELNKWLLQSMPVASLLYFVLLIFPLLNFIRNYRYVNIIRNDGLSKAPVQWRMFVAKVSAQMGIKKPVHIWVSELVSSPVTIGYLKKVILIPVAAVSNLSPRQLEAVLLHELSHIKRYDYLINLIINSIQTLLYFNPFVKAFVKIIEREREKSCDEMVLQFQYDPHGYATALFTLEKTNQLPNQLIIAASGKKNDLLHRVEHIMGVNAKPVFTFNKLAGLLAGILCIIAIHSLLLMKKTAKETTASFAQVASPFSFTTGSDGFTNDSGKPAATENKSSPSVSATAKPVMAQKKDDYEGQVSSIAEAANYPADFERVKYDEPVVAAARLKAYQEKQVKEAITASKKVLEAVQWKAVEKNIADVFTQQEKQNLKSSYQKEFEKINWDKWENKLRYAYDKIDWNRINNQLQNEVNKIKLDSLHYVYNEVAGKLDMVKEQLSLNNLTGIPDTDISLYEIEKKKAEVEKVLSNIKAVRNKKIVHL